MRPLLAILLLFGFLSAAAQSDPQTAALREAVEQRATRAVEAMPNPFAHGMRSAGQSAEDARGEINLWIRYNMQRAFGYKAKGDMESALFHFFMARHALRAVTYPDANDENGDPAVLSNPPRSRRAAVRPGSWVQRVDEDMRIMFEAAYVPAGDLLKMYGIDSDSGPTDRPGQRPRPNLDR